jgi:hypothetical protein
MAVMKRTSHLLVYRYEYWDERSSAVRTSERYATLDSIRKRLAVPLLDTAKVIPREELVNEFAA